MAHDARALANLLLDLGEAHGLSLTHMAVHKIAYFAHGWHLVGYGIPLITQPFEAWKYGPILRPVWHEFRTARDQTITCRAEIMDMETGEFLPASSNFTAVEQLFIRDILKAYGRFPATRLSAMTHRRGGAWEKVWRSQTAVLGMRIPNTDIYEDFTESRLPIESLSI